jgi:hypothetical protein
MSCHGRASFDASGHPTSFAGFDILSHNTPLRDSIGAAPVGPIDPNWYWWSPDGPPSSPAVADLASSLGRIAMAAGFVWSVPFCAIDDTAKPPETTSKFCAGK